MLSLTADHQHNLVTMHRPNINQINHFHIYRFAWGTWEHVSFHWQQDKCQLWANCFGGAFWTEYPASLTHFVPHSGGHSDMTHPWKHTKQKENKTNKKLGLAPGELYYTCLNTTSHAALEWRHNGLDSVSNHQPHNYLLNRLFRRRSKKTSKLRVTGLSEGNSYSRCITVPPCRNWWCCGSHRNCKCPVFDIKMVPDIRYVSIIYNLHTILSWPPRRNGVRVCVRNISHVMFFGF